MEPSTRSEWENRNGLEATRGVRRTRSDRLLCAMPDKVRDVKKCGEEAMGKAGGAMQALEDGPVRKSNGGQYDVASANVQGVEQSEPG